jgi:anthranilate synthase component II
MQKIAVLDNYDSFTYNLVHLLREVTGHTPDVFRNDKVAVSTLAYYDSILLSPGPGIPQEAGIMPQVVRDLGATKNILGVCLGHQCIAEVFGGKLINMPHVCHGKGILTKVVDTDEKLFSGVPEEFVSGRYHSWMVDPGFLPNSLKVTAIDEESRIMALAHRDYRIRGVQFHPESILTQFGKEMIQNWLAC